MMGRPVVAVTRRLPGGVERELAARFDLRQRAVDVEPDATDYAGWLREADGILCTVTDAFPEERLVALPRRTRILANFGAGVNHIDLDAAARAGVVVTNTPDQLTEATADLTVALMLATLRRAGEGERMLRAGAWRGWRPADFLGREVHGRSLGVVGFGRIGQAVARRAALGFGMPVQYVSRRPATVSIPGVRPAESLEAMLAEVEIVSIHVPATTATRHLFDEARLRRMRRGAWLINTARGSIVDEAALVRVLGDGHLAGAGLDVFEAEPAVHPGLLELPGVVLLPHMGSATEETREAMGYRALANLDAYFRGDPVLDRVV